MIRNAGRVGILLVVLAAVVPLPGAYALDNETEVRTLEVRAPYGHKFNTGVDQRLTLLNADAAVAGSLQYRFNDASTYTSFAAEHTAAIRVEGVVDSLHVMIRVPAQTLAEVTVEFRVIYCQTEDEQFCVLHTVSVPINEMGKEQPLVVHLPTLETLFGDSPSNLIPRPRHM